MMNKTLSRAVLTIVFSLASLSATATTYSFTLLDGLAGSDSTASSINNLGQIVGYSNPIYGVSQAILWNNGVATDLHPQGSVGSRAHSINNLGQIVGELRNAGQQPRAALWNNGVATDITPQGSVFSNAYSINDSGQIVGYSLTDLYRATVWNNGVATDLHPQGSLISIANSINNLGQIVGRSWTADGPRAIIWNNGVATVLPPNDTNFSIANSINDSGQVVGNSNPIYGVNQAILWNNGVAIDLNSFLSASDQSEGWVLTAANDINDSGSIVGSAINAVSGAQRGFLLQSVASVPEAGTSAMLLIGASVMGFMVRRRQNTQA